ncbi:MAG: hypothetical protein WAT39_12965 [Planctomycetota bacterium]
MTTTNDTLGHFRTLEVLIQSQLAALTGPEQGIIVVLPHIRKLEAYTTVGSGLDLGNPDSLRRLKWIKAEPSGPGWICREVSEADRDEFIKGIKP